MSLAKSILFCSALLTFAANATADSIHIAFDLYSNPSTTVGVGYLSAVSNAQLSMENFGQDAHYWSPTFVGIEGQVVYDFPTPFPVASASVYARTTVFFPSASALVDVSPNGLDWTNIGGGGNPSIVDVGSIVSGSQDIFVRARLLSNTSPQIISQFLRSLAPGQDSQPIFVLDASNVVPEPSTLALSAFGFIALAWRLRRRTPSRVGEVLAHPRVHHSTRAHPRVHHSTL